ncbi:O-antigen ligase family protein [Stenotrophomonas indicatrix]|uniref:O-antigen ligase family protein n=1 Tax=Stenotrophomonas indicatrix TaxID=2045451 RepID=UPI00320ACBE7
MNETPSRHSPSEGIRVPSVAVLFFVLGAMCLDLNLPRLESIKTGNFAMILLIALSVGSVALANGWRVPRPSIKSSNRLLVVYLALIGASATWSPSLADTLYQLALLSVIFFGTIMISSAPVELVVRYVFLFGAIASVLSLLVIPVDHSLAFQPFTSGDRPELRGIFEHQLRLGLFTGCALGLLTLVWLNGDMHRVFPRRWWVLLAVPVMVGVFYLAYARLYSVFVVAALMLTASFSMRKPVRWAVTVIAIAAIAFALTFQAGIESTLAAAGVDTSLTGRTTIWMKTANEAMLSPWKGYGFGSFDNAVFDHMWPGFYRPPHPHNSFLQAFFETGYLGMVLVILLALSHLAVSGRKDPERPYSYTFFMVVTMILGSLTGANYASKPVTLYCLVTLMVSMAISSREGSQSK